MHKTNRTKGLLLASAVFLLLIPLIFALGLISNFKEGFSRVFNRLDLSDAQNRFIELLYGTENTIAVMTSILVAGIALFVSIALLYWNQNIDSMFSYLKYIREQIHYYTSKAGHDKEINELKER